MTVRKSFALESYARNSINYYEQLVDDGGLPYFNVFWTSPAEAAHDWPDFGDVMSRQWQGAIMLRRMTGEEALTERVWQSKILSLIDPDDGQLHRPETSYCKTTADWGDAALTLYALVTAAVDSGESALKGTAVKMAEGMLERLRSADSPADSSFSGFAVKSLMVTARLLGCEAALEAARLLVERYLVRGSMFTPDNALGPRWHMHGGLRSMVGAADYALTIGDPVLYTSMDALYRSVKATATRFGFLPEVVNWRQSDLIACETCALMDFAGIGVTLANHGHPEYWGDMERLMRNHYVESQVRDGSWLECDDARPDTYQFTWRDIGSRIVGAWAGWSAPNHILAYRETLNSLWGGPELRDKTRVLQNCCGGSGVHGLFILWKNAARYEAGTLSVHLHLDKKLPQAEIRCQQPYRGLLRIALSEECTVRVRIPGFTCASEMGVSVNDTEMPIVLNAARSGLDEQHGDEPRAARAFGNYLEMGRCRPGDCIKVSYPLPIVTEEIAVGNPGYRQWRYRVIWKGDTVVHVEPLGKDVRMAYSDFDKADREVYYGVDGPGPLYQRAWMLQEIAPAEADLHLDDGALDLWRIGGPSA